MSRGGRGRGGGRATMSALQTELIGKSIFSKSEERLESFPEYDCQTAKEPTREEQHIVLLMDNFKSTLKRSAFYLEPRDPPKDIERYSDRYFTGTSAAKSLRGIPTDLNLFPDELHGVISQRKVSRVRKTAENGYSLLATLDGAKDDEEEEEEEKKDGDEEPELEEEDVEEEEEENDYIDSYFDNGEGDDIDADEDEGGGDYY